MKTPDIDVLGSTAHKVIWKGNCSPKSKYSLDKEVALWQSNPKAWCRHPPWPGYDIPKIVEQARGKVP